MEHSCSKVEPSPKGAWEGLRLVRSYCVFHLMRWFPTWAGWLPRHQPQISLVRAPERIDDATPAGPHASSTP
jgi:cardiolipin synthase